MITAKQLSDACGCSMAVAERWLQWINETLDAFQINTPARQAAFLPQLAHESGRLHYTTEIWGPTPAQGGYEGRADLGNTQPGDGYKFRGHGLIQTTGRANHARVRDGLRAMGYDCYDFEEDPAALAIPRWAALSAGLFWSDHNLNALADAGEMIKIGRAINRGNPESSRPANGETERLALWSDAKDTFGVA